MDAHQKENWQKLSDDPVKRSPCCIMTWTIIVECGDTKFKFEKYNAKYHPESEAQPNCKKSNHNRASLPHRLQNFDKHRIHRF